MSEAVEWRQASNSVKLDFLQGVVWLTLAYVLLFLTSTADGLGKIVFPIFGLLACLAAVVQLADGMARKKDGYCRAMLERNIFGYQVAEYPDPPLDEWEDDLELRNAFEVNYESK